MNSDTYFPGSGVQACPITSVPSLPGFRETPSQNEFNPEGEAQEAYYVKYATSTQDTLSKVYSPNASSTSDLGGNFTLQSTLISCHPFDPSSMPVADEDMM
eukprot:gnl/Dysnectes_brevis/1909_a2191_3167.p1 GENE.gnl/Dysnectes_brevis/1909_a2191_3167~~gnl/Dysnectes_brevis/1909_a2191_3167.p1  ORF type:complete len:101 (-),score=11.20 gnl/Dysnectes_brevis/1909_a2191_3167:109-411(-)